MVRSLSLRQYFAKTSFGNIVAPVVLLLLLFFFYVNGALYFGTLWSNFQPIILLYILGTVIAVVIAPELLRVDPKAPLWLEAVAYIVPAIVLNLVLWVAGVRGLQNVGPVSSNPLAVILLQIGVTGSEEILFRGALWYRTSGQRAPLWFAILLSSGTFAAFHAYAYGVALISMGFAAATGGMFYYIYHATKDRYGLAVNTGLHLGYNCAMLGVFILAPLFL